MDVHFLASSLLPSLPPSTFPLPYFPLSLPSFPHRLNALVGGDVPYFKAVCSSEDETLLFPASTVDEFCQQMALCMAEKHPSKRWYRPSNSHKWQSHDKKYYALNHLAIILWQSHMYWLYSMVLYVLHINHMTIIWQHCDAYIIVRMLKYSLYVLHIHNISCRLHGTLSAYYYPYLPISSIPLCVGWLYTSGLLHAWMMLTVARVRAAIVPRPPALVTYNTHTNERIHAGRISTRLWSHPGWIHMHTLKLACSEKERAPV